MKLEWRVGEAGDGGEEETIDLKPHDKVRLISSKIKGNIGLMGVVIRVRPNEERPITVFWDALCHTIDGNYTFVSDIRAERLEKIHTFNLCEKCDMPYTQGEK